jgi:hypothetical protein
MARARRHRLTRPWTIALAAAALAVAALAAPAHTGATALDTDVTYTVYQSPAAGSVVQVGSTVTFTVDITSAPGSFIGPVNYDLKKPANMSFVSYGSQSGNVVTSCADNTPSAAYVRCVLGSGGVPAGALSTGTATEIVLNFTVSAAAAGATYTNGAMQGLFSDAGSGFRNAYDTPDSTAAGGSNDDSLDASVGGLTVTGAGVNVFVSPAAVPASVFEGGLSTITVTITHGLAPIGPLIQPVDITVTNGDLQSGTVTCPGGTGSSSIVGSTAHCTGSTVDSGDTMSVVVRARDTAAGDDVSVTVAALSFGLASTGFVIGVSEVGLETFTLPVPGVAIPPFTTGAQISVCTASVLSDAPDDAAAGAPQDPTLVAGTSTLSPTTPLQSGDFSVTGPGGTVLFTPLSQLASACGSAQTGVQFTAASAGTYTVSAFYNGDTTSAGTVAATRGSNSLAISVQAPNGVPSISSLSPASGSATGTGFTLTVNGSNFVPGSVVRWNGSDRATGYVSSGQLTATIPGSDMAAAGSVSVTVFNPAPGGGLSGASTFTINGAPNPAPLITTLVPATANAGTPGFTITVFGTGFVPGASVLWNGSARTTTFINAGQLTASILTADLASAVAANVSVFNPAPGGGTSPVASFSITSAANPSPVITSTNPATVAVGGSSFTITVSGSGFVGSSVVRWNGSDRATSFVSSTTLTATILAADIQVTGSPTVTVFSPGPGGGISASATVSVTNPAPAITGLAPASATVGAAGLSVTVTGSGFVNGSTVRWNGTDLVTAYVNATTLNATVPAGSLATAALVSVTVFNPTPGGGTSPAATFSVNNPAPVITSLAPATASAAGAAFTLTVDGTGFVDGAVVRWNGSDRTTTFVSATRLTAAVLASDVLTQGTATVTVFNPAPGGGQSAGQSFTIGAPVLTASDQLVVAEPPDGTLVPRSRLSFSATTGTLAPSAVSFVIKRTSDGKYWNGSAHAWQTDLFENAAAEADDGPWEYAVTGDDRRQFVNTVVTVEARATAAGLPYKSAAAPTLDIR